jgi:hypothetical protein
MHTEQQQQQQQQQQQSNRFVHPKDVPPQKGPSSDQHSMTSA